MRRFFIFLIQVYRVSVSPMIHTLVPIRSGCRFPQTCSEYTMNMIRSRGVLPGIRLGLMRLSRCHPFFAVRNAKLQ